MLIVVTAISASLGVAIVAWTTDGGPVGVTEAAPEATVTSVTERRPVGAAMGMAAEGTTPGTMQRGPVAATKATPEPTAAGATEQRSAGARQAAEPVATAGAPDAGAGRRVFLGTCKKCHTLTSGDWRDDKLSLADLRPSYSTVRDKVTSGGVAMPAFKGKLSEQEIRNVAAFVAKAVGQTGQAGGGEGGGEGESSGEGGGGGEGESSGG